jgi:hypothetical protein
MNSRQNGSVLRRRLVPVQQKQCSMSHHFDTPTAREDPRICVNDFYLFDGAAGTTVMAMTVNPDAGLSAPETFRDEGLYAFRFDLNGDAREELTFKFSVMLTLAANQTLSDGVAPDRQRMRSEFPYFGEPYTHDEQHGLSPAAQPATK